MFSNSIEKGVFIGSLTEIAEEVHKLVTISHAGMLEVTYAPGPRPIKLNILNTFILIYIYIYILHQYVRKTLGVSAFSSW
jgi:hypothetical protein